MTTEFGTQEIKTTTTETVTQDPTLVQTDVLNPIVNEEEEPEIEAVLKPIYTREVRKAIVKEIKLTYTETEV